MTSRAGLNLLLLLALAALVLVALYEPGREAETPPPPLTALDAAEIDRIALQRPLRDDLVMQREGDHWILAGEPPLRADAARINQLLRLAGERPLRSYGLGTMQPQRIGLGEDAVQLTFNEATVLRFGATDPLDGHRYVQAGEQVHLIPNRYQPLLEARREFWLSRRLLPQEARIVSLALPDLTLHRDNEGHWQPEPEDPHLGTDEMVALIQRWENTEALAVNTGMTPGPEDAQVTVHLEGAKEPVRFAIRADGDDRLFLRPDLGLAYRLGDHQARRLLAPQPIMEAVPALP